ncbi:MAG: cation ABC transporter substrate-binding protein [Spirochaetae bacterium HGW-Spirochaetae-1]|jgi:zinc transport system substrate-binding protein|nr:MAG: cation ABC transporter substrate-binding protein [Spirochaetae bacterium HGW-Spirochaetae-1]
MNAPGGESAVAFIRSGTKSMKKTTFIILIIAVLVIAAQGCKKMEEQGNIVSVSIIPLQYFVQRIGGPGFKVNVLIPPGQSPHTYEPTSQQMIEMSRSRAFFKTGLFPLEDAFLRSMTSTGSGMMIIDSSEGVNLISAHHHDHTGYGHDSGIDPHIWLSPAAVRIMAKNILAGFIAIDPAGSTLYRNNFQAFMSDIDALDIYIKGELKQVKEKKFLVYHPVWSYFARDYGLTQIPMEIEGKEPDPTHIKDIVDMARREKIRVIFVQKQEPLDYARSLAGDIHGKVVHLDPLEGDWIANMRTTAKTFKTELE